MNKTDILRYNFIVNNNEWSIKLVDVLDISLVVNNQRYNGITDYANQIISLCKDSKIDSQFKTLLYELSHVFLYEMQLQYKKQFGEELCEFVGLFGLEIFNIAKDCFHSFAINIEEYKIFLNKHKDKI